MAGNFTFAIESDGKPNLDFHVDSDGEASVCIYIDEDHHEWPVEEMDLHSLRAFCDEAIRKMAKGVVQ